jgi:arsenate reductase-like glutaredoxin family protein
LWTDKLRGYFTRIAKQCGFVRIKKMGNVQIFGVKNSPATRAAERFFKERGVPLQLIDLKQKAMAPGELRRFIEQFGLSGLLDQEGKAYVDAGLKYLKLSDSELLGRIERDPKLLRLPLVRGAKQVSIGHDKDSWKQIALAVR